PTRVRLVTARARRGLVWAVLAVLVTGCSPRQPEAAASPSASPAPAPSAPASRGPERVATPGPGAIPITFRGSEQGNRPVTVIEQKGNRKVYVLRAASESGRLFDIHDARSKLVAPLITFYLSDGRTLVASAPRATVRGADHSITLLGGVHAHSSDGMTLTSDSLRYDGTSQVLHAEGNVHMTSPQGERMQGRRLDWNVRTSEVDLSALERVVA
ncbi:MAG: LPS export ABC transporter periplasmic protein LptC, partial [Vulcanimicrobiaceae bacterium]